MNRMASTLNLTARGMNDSQTLEFLFQKKENLRKILGGIQFDDSLSGNSVLPKKLYAAIRFPAELRNSTKNTGVKRSSWKTDILFPSNRFRGPRSEEFKETAPPGIDLLYLKKIKLIELN